jgi:hypothetical protein
MENFTLNYNKKNLQLSDNPLYTDVCHRNTNTLSDSHHVPVVQLANYQTPSSEKDAHTR